MTAKMESAIMIVNGMNLISITLNMYHITIPEANKAMPADSSNFLFIFASYLSFATTKGISTFSKSEYVGFDPLNLSVPD